ncbi:SGNH hydrolase domain-containing protein [Aeromicrobium panaciterrae]|uniref:acyltransferase family protein n=1 Tax=Aeromicrobium panaciterrae TaxID=363861 RepID=UPI0031E387D3
MAARTRGDIQGLRAVAVLVVVAYHAGVPFMSGGFVGVDLFFVLSGFLITGLLVAEHRGNGTVRLREFWARRARRLLPASALVLVATALAVHHFIDPVTRKPIGDDILFASGFAANWRFAWQQTDYLAGDRDPSPVLHFWSLGVEEQFYVVWPLLILVIGYLAHRFVRDRFTVVLTAVFSIVTVASFILGVALSEGHRPYAFFSTPSRAWQLAVGALLALAVPLLGRLRPTTRILLGFTGLALMGISVVLLKESGQLFGLTYPSWLALAPTAGAALLIGAGTGGATWLTRALSWRPLTYIGDRSYSWYLWHWPVLVIGQVRFGDDAPVRLGLVLCSLLLTILTFRFVEQPLRFAPTLRARPAASLALGAALIVAAVPAAAFAASGPSIDRVQVEDSSLKITPALDKAATDIGPFIAKRCLTDSLSAVLPPANGCAFGKVGAPQVVYLIGDSIAESIAPALVAAADQEGWELRVRAKSRCPFADVTRYDSFVGGVATLCDKAKDAIVDEILDARPAAVVIAMAEGSTFALWDDGDIIRGQAATDQSVAGMTTFIRRFTAAGIGVSVAESPARAQDEPTACLARERAAERCTFRRPQAPGTSVPARAASLDDVPVVRINDPFCDDTTCGPLAGRIVVYRDKVHFTQTFARTLASAFITALRAAAPTL